MFATSQYHQSSLPRLAGQGGYVPTWKVVGAADKGRDGDGDTVKTNFAEMDVK